MYPQFISCLTLIVISRTSIVHTIFLYDATQHVRADDMQCRRLSNCWSRTLTHCIMCTFVESMTTLQLTTSRHPTVLQSGQRYVRLERCVVPVFQWVERMWVRHLLPGCSPSFLRCKGSHMLISLLCVDDPHEGKALVCVLVSFQFRG